MAGVEVHRDAPGEAGTADAQILQTGLDEVVDHLIDTAPGLQKIRVLQQVTHPVGVLAQPEEVGLLLGIRHLTAAVGAFAVHQLALGPEALAGLAVLAPVGPLIDIPLVIHPPEDLLDGGHMIVVGGADEPVVGDVHQLPQVEDPSGALHDLIQKLLGGLAGGLGLVLDLLAVLVGAGEEHDIAAGESLIASHSVSGHRAVGMANVELVGGVVNRGSDIELLLFHGWISPFPPSRMEGRLKITGTEPPSSGQRKSAAAAHGATGRDDRHVQFIPCRPVCQPLCCFSRGNTV